MTTEAEALDLFHRTEAPTLTRDELQLFAERCQRRGIDPLLRFVIPNLREDNRGVRRIVDMTTIDAYRSIAMATGEYTGQAPPLWCGTDGVWRDVWLSSSPPSAALVRIYRKGFTEPVGQPALWREYVQTLRSGDPNRSWANMGALMLAKCSEALGFRKAFPETLSGTYTGDEMGQADSDAPTPAPAPPAAGAPASRVVKDAPACDPAVIAFLAPQLAIWEGLRDGAKKIGTPNDGQVVTEYWNTISNWWNDDPGREACGLWLNGNEVDQAALTQLFKKQIAAGKFLGVDVKDSGKKIHDFLDAFEGIANAAIIDASSAQGAPADDGEDPDPHRNVDTESDLGAK